MQFKIGDVVRLKSGGPKMTFSEMRGDGFAVATWFVEDDGPFDRTFEPEMLELAADEDAFYEDDEPKYAVAHAKWLKGVPLSAEEWEVFTRDENEDEHLSDVELDAIVADYERDRGR